MPWDWLPRRDALINYSNTISCKLHVASKASDCASFRAATIALNSGLTLVGSTLIWPEPKTRNASPSSTDNGHPQLKHNMRIRIRPSALLGSSEDAATSRVAKRIMPIPGTSGGDPLRSDLPLEYTRARPRSARRHGLGQLGDRFRFPTHRTPAGIGQRASRAGSRQHPSCVTRLLAGGRQIAAWNQQVCAHIVKHRSTPDRGRTTIYLKWIMVNKR